MSEKTPRIKKQAIYEINVVKSCSQNYLEKLAEIKKRTGEISAQIDVLLELGRLSSSETERREYAGRIRKLRENLEIMKDDESCFQDNVDMFDELEILLNSFFLHERYRYIVRKIPEKKLPLMVKDPDKREEVNDLLLSLLEEFNITWQKYLLGMKRRKEKREHIENMKKNFKERNATPDKEIDAIMDEFSAHKAEETEDNTTTETPKRKHINN